MTLEVISNVVSMKIAGALEVMIPIMIPQIVTRSKQTEVVQSDVKFVLICANTPGQLCYKII